MLPFSTRLRGWGVGTLMLTLPLVVSLPGCTPRKVLTDEEQGPVAAEDYHADLDIAMTLGSIADALRVGEPLDSADYSFEGILTDGEGRPLYTDFKGVPGIWDVDVITTRSAVARNVNLGDLLPDDLTSYLCASMNLTDNDIVDALRLDEGDEEMEMVVYDISGAYLRIETRRGMTPTGLEGPLMRITLSRDLPQHPED